MLHALHSAIVRITISLQIEYVDIFVDLFRDAEVTVSTEISVRSPDYFKQLDDLLEDEAEDKDR